jgi:argonaute-like protein implicated in RNA metabolism and viral defense
MIKTYFTKEVPLPVQCVRVDTLLKKWAVSALDKVVLQMIAKVGGTPWATSRPEEILEYSMLVGIDVCHSGNKSIVGFTATMNQQMNIYFSTVRVQSNGHEELIGQLGGCFI